VTGAGVARDLFGTQLAVMLAATGCAFLLPAAQRSLNVLLFAAILLGIADGVAVSSPPLAGLYVAILAWAVALYRRRRKRRRRAARVLGGKAKAVLARMAARLRAASPGRLRPVLRSAPAPAA
jgi:hypothetical protein